MKLEIGKQYDVTVVKILAVGAVVQMEDETTELVHISNIADCYVSDVADFVSVGQKYTATCEAGTKVPIQLSFKPLELKSQRKPPERSYRNQSSKRTTDGDSLDKMIASANSSFEEKNRANNKRSQRG